MLLQVMKEAGILEPKVIHGEKRPGDVMRNFSDTSKAASKLSWKTKMSLNEGLFATLQYFLESRSNSVD